MWEKESYFFCHKVGHQGGLLEDHEQGQRDLQGSCCWKCRPWAGGDEENTSVLHGLDSQGIQDQLGAARVLSQQQCALQSQPCPKEPAISSSNKKSPLQEQHWLSPEKKIKIMRERSASQLLILFTYGLLMFDNFQEEMIFELRAKSKKLNTRHPNYSSLMIRTHVSTFPRARVCGVGREEKQARSLAKTDKWLAAVV